ncbi:alpha/beta hydrolase family protein [Streptomyces griseoviridis]|uniref:alpha/beta hydrolase family protein n=1 Tax=Streptomyces griseoviridis TaxID=45398 RepID=UPI00343D7CE7
MIHGPGRVSARRGYTPAGRRRGNGPYAIDESAEDIHRLIETLGEEPPPFTVGHSLGGVIATARAASHPGPAPVFCEAEPPDPEPDPMASWLTARPVSAAREHGARGERLRKRTARSPPRRR